MKVHEIEQRMESFGKDLTMEELSAATVANYHKALKKFIGFCHQGKVELVTRETLLETAKKHGRHRCYCMMRLLASTGVRLGEATHVTVESLKTGIFLLRVRENPGWSASPMKSARNWSDTVARRA